MVHVIKTRPSTVDAEPDPKLATPERRPADASVAAPIRSGTPRLSTYKPSPKKTMTPSKGHAKALNRPMTVSLSNIMSNRQPFTRPDTIDKAHPKMRAILRDAGLPYTLQHMNDLRPADIAQIMDCLVLAVEAYSHYQQVAMAAGQDMEQQIRELSKQLAAQEKSCTDQTIRADAEARRVVALTQQKSKLENRLNEKIEEDKKKIACLEKAAIDAGIREKQYINQVARLTQQVKSLTAREAQLSSAVAKQDGHRPARLSLPHASQTQPLSNSPSKDQRTPTNAHLQHAHRSPPNNTQASPNLDYVKVENRPLQPSKLDNADGHINVSPMRPLSASPQPQELPHARATIHISPTIKPHSKLLAKAVETKNRENFQGIANADGGRGSLSASMNLRPEGKVSVWKRLKAKFKTDKSLQAGPRAFSDSASLTHNQTFTS